MVTPLIKQIIIPITVLQHVFTFIRSLCIFIHHHCCQLLLNKRSIYSITTNGSFCWMICYIRIYNIYIYIVEFFCKTIHLFLKKNVSAQGRNILFKNTLMCYYKVQKTFTVNIIIHDYYYYYYYYL